MDSEAVQVSQADRDAAADFLESWEPGPEMTVVKLARAFARARLQEREECARVVDAHAALWSDEDVVTDMARAAAAIRSRP